MRIFISAGEPSGDLHAANLARALRRRLGMDETKLLLTFQSRFGFDEWLQPYTDKTLEKLASEGLKRVAVVNPGFVATPMTEKNRYRMPFLVDAPDGVTFEVPSPTRIIISGIDIIMFFCSSPPTT